jgi:hypothetical protein
MAQRLTVLEEMARLHIETEPGERRGPLYYLGGANGVEISELAYVITAHVGLVDYINWYFYTHRNTRTSRLVVHMRDLIDVYLKDAIADDLVNDVSFLFGHGFTNKYEAMRTACREGSVQVFRYLCTTYHYDSNPNFFDASCEKDNNPVLPRLFEVFSFNMTTLINCIHYCQLYQFPYNLQILERRLSLYRRRQCP